MRSWTRRACVLAAALALGAAGATGASAGQCQYDLACRQCGELPGCGLARAAATRKAIGSAKS